MHFLSHFLHKYFGKEQTDREMETDQSCNYLAPVLASVLLINDSQLQILVTRCVILREEHV